MFVPLDAVGEEDIICGRGGLANRRPANRKYRRLIRKLKGHVRAKNANERQKLAECVFSELKRTSRFFTPVQRTFYMEMTPTKVIEKLMQCIADMRENGTDVESTGPEDEVQMEHHTPRTVYRILRNHYPDLYQQLLPNLSDTEFQNELRATEEDIETSLLESLSIPDAPTHGVPDKEPITVVGGNSESLSNAISNTRTFVLPTRE